MALVSCPECKKKVSEAARACPGCGYEFKPGQLSEIRKTETTGKRIGYGILIVGFILMVNYCSDDGPSESDEKASEPVKKELSWDEIDNTSEAYIYTQWYVEQQLKSPGSAEFPIGTSDYVKKHGSIYIINSYVDAQNSYGALLRSHFRAKVQQKGKHDWIMIEFEFLN